MPFNPLPRGILVATHRTDSVDWSELGEWIHSEGIADSREAMDLYRAAGRSLP